MENLETQLKDKTFILKENYLGPGMAKNRSPQTENRLPDMVRGKPGEGEGGTNGESNMEVLVFIPKSKFYHLFIL